ncbi:MAG: signal peptidase I [Clostridia bacterium]|jgi:signal peptidase I|nr:signal peptidase I [Clostridia bacterium]MBQ6000492.1 signal peptidase I [Clostridia bacterium]MBQ6058735.1 signal peptidase I [Clostridia bacterium]
MEDRRSEKAPQKSRYFELYDWWDCLVYSVLIVVLILSFGVRLIGVDGTSMVPTLQDQDRVLLRSAFYTPKAGDIVVFSKLSEPLVKRIVATEGQIVDIDWDNGVVYVDGVAQYEPYVNEPTYKSGTVAFPVMVPSGCVFVMGDNRNRSTDSRWVEVGMVDTRHILGKVFFRIMPFSEFGLIANS